MYKRKKSGNVCLIKNKRNNIKTKYTLESRFIIKKRATQNLYAQYSLTWFLSPEMTGLSSYEASL